MSDDVWMATSLRNAPSSGLSMQQIEGLRRRAWVEHGVSVFVAEEIADNWLRQAIINESIRRYGKRQAKRMNGGGR